MIYGNKTIYFIIMSLALVGLAAGVILVALRTPSTKYADSISYSLPTGTYDDPSNPAKNLPVVHNLPPEVSLSQTNQIRRIVAAAGGKSADYRNNSLVYGSENARLLIDVPSISQTYIILLSSSSTVSVECADTVDQKEPGWSCALPEMGDE